MALSGIHAVNEIMNRNVSALDSCNTVLDALRIMTEKGVGCVVVTSASKPVGIVTERDVMKAMMKGKEVLEYRLHDVMSRPLMSVPPNTAVAEALNVMKSRNIRRLPVVREDKLLGIITIHKDLLYWALAAAGKEEPRYTNPTS
jgi:CBS domain-containing protein